MTLYRLVMRVIARIAAFVQMPDGTEPLALRFERFFITVRWVGIALLGTALPLTNLPPRTMLAAYTILLLAALYNTVITYILRTRPHVMRSGYITTIGDALLNVAMISVGGGFEGPFYFILFTMTISAVMRYGYGPAMLVAGMYVGLDFISGVSNSAVKPLDSVAFLFRSAFLMITTLLAGYLREQARSAEQALADQLRQASALNESTQALSASLDLAVVMRTIVEAGRRLAEAETAILRLGAPINQMIISQRGAVAIEDTGVVTAFETNSSNPCAPDELIAITQADEGEPVGQEYQIFRFVSHKGAKGVFAVCNSTLGTRQMPASQETLGAFVDRAALAIEKALLYKALADRTDELRRAYAELAAAHQELISVDEMKTNFLANVSHELRTPLTAIRSFSEILLSYDQDRVTQEEFIGIISSESERLTRLVNDVLDITKIEAGRMEWHMDLLQLDEVLRESARAVTALVEEKGLQLQIDLPTYVPPVWADRDRIVQVVANLLGNAIKFTKAGSIRVMIQVAGNELHTSIIDTGIGIAAEDQKRIFEKFHQVGDTLTDKPRGTGLGLCLCRDILSHQGGRIWVKSTLHQGSTFTFSLPLAEVVASQRQMTVYSA